MVFQSYALYPHLTVEKNISFPLRAVGMPKAEIRKKVEWAARMFGIERFLDRKPRQLSGGERQRVALARAVVREPVVFLLDEPLSNLDAKLRNSARDELKQFQQVLGTTTIYVTHDQAEAMGLGDRIAVLNQGKVRQVGTPAGDLRHADRHLRRDLHRLAADEPDRGRRDLARIPAGGVPAAARSKAAATTSTLPVPRHARRISRRRPAGLRRDRRPHARGARHFEDPDQYPHRDRRRASATTSSCAGATSTASTATAAGAINGGAS